MLVNSRIIIKLSHVSLGLIEHNKESDEARDCQEVGHAEEAGNFANSMAVLAEEIAILVALLLVFAREPWTIVANTIFAVPITLLFTFPSKLAAIAESILEV